MTNVKPTIALLLFVALCAMAAACRAYRPAAETTAITDTVTVHVVERDTAVVVRSDSAMMRALVECDSTGKARLRQILELRNGQRVNPPQVSLRGDTLVAVSTADSMAIYLTLRDRYTDTRRESVTERVIEVNRPTWWQKLWMGLGRVFAVAVAITVIYKLLKQKVKL